MIRAVYKAERDAGLEEKILSQYSLAYYAQAELSDSFQILDRVKSSLHKTQANQNDYDLHYLKTILVTTGWNKNDDVFDKAEVWIARNTPEDKPFNYEHDCSKIIGHITGNYVIDADSKEISDKTIIDDLPAKYHIVTQAVLYKYWEKAELQELMDGIIKEIAENKWFVSMEALFNGFDYCLKNTSETKVVARNEETAFLTKHLRSYGGDGKYDGYKVGRLLRNITFSGKGLVRKPANPESEILQSKGQLGYCFADTGIKEEVKMTELEILKNKLDELSKENQKLQASLQDSNAKELKIKIEKLEADLKVASDNAVSLQKTIDATKANEDKLNKEKEDLAKTLEAEKKTHQTVAEELTKIKTEQKKQARIVAVKKALHVDETNAEAVKAAIDMVESLFDLSDEKFDLQVKAIAKFTPAPAPPKSTPAQTPPQSTSFPAPLLGKGSEVADGETSKPDTKVLETVETKTEASLSTETVDNGVEDLRKSIASFLGYEEQE